MSPHKVHSTRSSTSNSPNQFDLSSLSSFENLEPRELIFLDTKEDRFCQLQSFETFLNTRKCDFCKRSVSKLIGPFASLKTAEEFYFHQECLEVNNITG